MSKEKQFTREIVEELMELYTSELNKKLNLLFKKVEQIENKSEESSEIASSLSNNMTVKEDRIEYNYKTSSNISTNLKDDEIDVQDYVIGSVLEDYIERNGINKTWLSEQTGISRGTIITIVKNPASVSLCNAYKISKVLKQPLEILFPFVHMGEN